MAARESISHISILDLMIGSRSKASVWVANVIPGLMRIPNKTLLPYPGCPVVVAPGCPLYRKVRETSTPFAGADADWDLLPIASGVLGMLAIGAAESRGWRKPTTRSSPRILRGE